MTEARPAHGGSALDVPKILDRNASGALAGSNTQHPDRSSMTGAPALSGGARLVPEAGSAARLRNAAPPGESFAKGPGSTTYACMTSGTLLLHHFIYRLRKLR